MTMFNFVSTVSKSFPDLLKFWESRDTGHSNARKTRHPVTIQTHPSLEDAERFLFSNVDSKSARQKSTHNSGDEINKKHIETGWKNKSGLIDGETTPFLRTNPTNGPPTETASLCSFRSSNRNIDYLTKNSHTVSSQSMNNSDYPTKSIDSQSKENNDWQQIDADKQSVVSESRMFKKSTKSSRTSQISGAYKKSIKSGDKRSKRSKPNSESSHEMDLARKSVDHDVMLSKVADEINSDMRQRVLSASQQSMYSYDGDYSAYPESTRSERSLSIPSVPQTYVRVDSSSHVFVNTAGSTGGMPSERISFGSSPSRAPMSTSSGESLSYSVRNSVAEKTKLILEDHTISKTSVETNRLEEARKRLQQNSFLILTGNDGDGLTTIGYDLLLDYPDREQFIVMDIKEVLPCLTQAADKPVIVFADDVFGTTYFDAKRFEGWRRMMNQIQSLIRRNNAILVLALNNKFMTESKCKEFCDYYQDSILNISRPDLQLDLKERTSILRNNVLSQMERLGIEICKTKEEESLNKNTRNAKSGRRISEQTIDDIARGALPSGFPGKVAHFLKSVDNIKRGASFFTSPTVEMFDEIDTLRTSNTEEHLQIYLGLVAVFVYGSLNFDTFDIHCQYLVKSEKALRNYLQSCSGKSHKIGHKTKCPDMINVLVGFAKKFKLMSTLAESVKKGVIMMLGKYLKEQMKGQFTLASLSVEKAVAISCSNEFPVDICKNTSKRIFNSIFGPDAAFDEKELHVSITEKDKALRLAVIHRLHQLVSSNKLLELIQHPAMRIPWFTKHFIKHIKKDKHALKTLIMSVDDRTNTSLFSLSLQYSFKAPGVLSSRSLAEDFMLSGKWSKIWKENPAFAEEKEQELVEKCCEMGWQESYFRLTEKGQVSVSTKCLSLAIDSGSINIIKDISNNTSMTKDDWYLALRQACEKIEENDTETLKIILCIKQIIPFEYQSDITESIIHSAARQGDDLLFSKAISLYDQKNIKNREGLTSIHLAVQGNHFYCVRQAIEHNVSQNIKDRKGELAIHYACRLGYTDIAIFLVEHDAGIVNCASNAGSTPLHLATENGHFEITVFLVTNGADFNVVDKKGRTPVYYAARHGTGQMLDFLLESAINVSITTEDDSNTSSTPKLNRDSQTVCAFSKAQALSKQRQILFNNCLIDIISENLNDMDKIDAIKHMLEKGANLNYVKENDLPLISLAIKSKCSETIIKMLLRENASVWQRDFETGDTALHTAVKCENKAVTELILHHEKDENLLRQRNKQNEMPLHIAADKGMVTIVELLNNEFTTNHFVVKNGRCLTALALAQEKRNQTMDEFEREKYGDVVKILAKPCR